MKRLFLILMLTIIVVSCKNDKKQVEDKNLLDSSTKETINKNNKINVLSHPLIFEDLGITIFEFTSEEIEANNFLITIGVEAVDSNLYNKGHYFFIHAFDFNQNGNSNFINFDTKEGIQDGSKIFFKTQIKSNIYDFGKFRFGLVNIVHKERYFVRTLLDVSIKN